MKQLGNTIFFDTLVEMLDPKHTALLVVDMQNDFASKGGFFEKKGVDISMIQDAIPNIAMLLDAAHSLHIPVFFTENTVEMDSDGTVLESPAHIAFYCKCGYLPGSGDRDFFTLDGSWGQQTVSALRPQEGDVVIKKHRSNAFIGTKLDEILRSKNVKTALVTGCVTQGCVESTVREAEARDYYVVVASDGVASQSKDLHEAALKIMSARWVVENCAKIKNTWTSFIRTES